MMSARHTRAHVLRVAVAFVSVATLQLSSGTAAADVVKDAKVRAAELRVTVAQLRVKAEVATESYDAAQAAVADSVSQYLQGEEQLAGLEKKADADRSLAAGRIIALYQSGGELGIYSNVLSGDGVVDMYDRLQMARTVISGDQSVITDGAASLAEVDKQQAKLNALRDKQSALERDAGRLADSARAATDKAEALLGAADSEVQRLVAEQEAAAAKAAAEEFARRVAAAQAAAAAQQQVHDGAQPTSAALAAIAAARTRLGLAYVWGATGPDTFDCSGLTSWAYRQAGVAIPRTAAQQWFAGPPVALSQLAPGDLLYWATDLTNANTIHHVAIYLGNGRMLAAPHSGAFVREENVYWDGFFGATRPAG
ncbi:MAG: peptidoglycan DL-endopeptidase CwlO [Frankiaceae bacterium]|jgi:cell wall-associated NlpC family hydrolase|nr:peptidoglycan DL-endopeptidase CwlO [Frankiaceae bacterium]